MNSSRFQASSYSFELQNCTDKEITICSDWSLIVDELNPADDEELPVDAELLVGFHQWEDFRMFGGLRLGPGKVEPRDFTLGLSYGLKELPSEFDIALTFQIAYCIGERTRHFAPMFPITICCPSHPSLVLRNAL